MVFECFRHIEMSIWAAEVLPIFAREIRFSNRRLKDDEIRKNSFNFGKYFANKNSMIYMYCSNEFVVWGGAKNYLLVSMCGVYSVRLLFLNKKLSNYISARCLLHSVWILQCLVFILKRSAAAVASFSHFSITIYIFKVYWNKLVLVIFLLLILKILLLCFLQKFLLLYSSCSE